MSRLARVGALGAVSLALASPVVASALAAPAAPDVPTAIQVPAGNKPFLVGHATGVQIYTCGSGGTWGTTSTPSAVLVGDNGKQIATHLAGPTWQATDGSSVLGARVDAVPGAPGAIPWLLLRAASTSAGPDGDRLTATTYIQRVNTAGGVGPTGTCTPGDTDAVPYTADYYFWKATGG